MDNSSKQCSHSSPKVVTIDCLTVVEWCPDCGSMRDAPNKVNRNPLWIAPKQRTCGVKGPADPALKRLRDEFAIAAMPVIVEKIANYSNLSDCARWSYQMADAMLKAREA